MEKDSMLTLFDLSSHERARQAIEFGLSMRKHNFHVFVLGDERSGRMTATLAYLQNYAKQLEAPSDWVYLNNFTTSYRPIPFSLPAGQGKVLQEDIRYLIGQLIMRLRKTFHDPRYRKKIDDVMYQLQTQWQKSLSDLHEEATQRQCRIVQQSDNSYDVECSDDNGLLENVYAVRRTLNYCIIQGQMANQQTQSRIHAWRIQAARRVLTKLLRPFRAKWKLYLGAWIDDLANDILENLDIFDFPLSQEEDAFLDAYILLDERFERYSVNILVDRTRARHPKVVVEPNPTYERLFGNIKYRNGPNGTEPHFTLIRGGALHEANGGILVLRADALARNPHVWEALKVALRDRRIRIEEPFRESMLPLWGAPEPHTIPLDTQIFLVSSPDWYYEFFSQEPDFHNYFKIKADIDPDMPATERNKNVYIKLVQQNAHDTTGYSVSQAAIQAVLQQSSRWANHCDRLSSRFEQVFDLVAEASSLLKKHDKKIDVQHIKQAIQARRQRESRSADRYFEHITQDQILLDTDGRRVGQVNGLTVLSTGDHNYGAPCRITARTYIGTQGVINIERLTHMGGAIQQKGTFILEAYLKGTFAQEHPLCSSCSITFEQSYIDIEGDSASLAELVAILSSLADLSVRQDVAITGAMNQWGHAHSVGGIHNKVEGFFALCQQRGLTGKQGVIIPETNAMNLSLRDEVLAAIENQTFTIWRVSSIEQACEILMEKSWQDDIFPRVQNKLARFAERVRMQGNNEIQRP